MPQQNQLIEEVVLEPEDHFVEVLRTGQCGVPATNHGEHAVDRFTQLCREVFRTQAHQVIVADVRRHRPVVERVGPDGKFAAHGRSLELQACCVTVEYVQHHRPMIAEPPA